MRSILTIAIIISSLSGMAQTKPKLNNYRIEANYVTDCKSGSMFETYSAFDEPTYPSIYKRFKKWVGNHKIVSFHITKFEKLKHPDKSKGGKFECEKPFDTAKLNFISSCDTCHFNFVGAGTWAPSSYVWRDDNKTYVKISALDSSKTTTVTFLKSEVHFINDSTFTFTFKQK